MMDDFRFVKCPICGWEKNPRMPCFNCGDKAPATSKTSSDTALAAAEAKLAYFEELAGERLLEITSDADRIAALEKALDQLYDAASEFSADQSVAADPRCAVTQPVTVEDAHALNAALSVAAALLKEKE